MVSSAASRASSSLPSLTTAGTSTASASPSTSMPASPRSNGHAGKDDVKVVKPEEDEDGPIDTDADPEASVRGLVNDVKEEADATGDRDAQARASRLTFLLERSSIYAKVIGERMERQQIAKQKAEQLAATKKQNKEKKAAEASANGSGARSGLRHAHQDKEEKEEQPVKGKRKARETTSRGAKKAKIEEEDTSAQPNGPSDADTAAQGGAEVDGDVKPSTKEEDNVQYSFKQPELVTGATLRDYQLAGVQWMISLYENGLNGILADEMGLGKTLQTISFLAHLRGKGTWGPFLIVCPLSVLNNWIIEFEKFCPSIPVIMYHGSKAEREELRRTRMSLPVATDPVGKSKGGRKSFGPKAGTNTTQTFPVIVTTYEICINDQKFLAGMPWKFIVVDEGHRLKNLNCKLIQQLKTYQSANRLILTGTPLHNNLSELWSLLNFILPDIFDDLDSFQQWFNFDDMDSVGGQDGLLDKSSVVTSLHAILKPFLLRRLKVDVERNLPPKKEYLLYAPLTQQQKDIYQAILSRSIRQYLIDKKGGKENDEEEAPAPPTEDEHGRSMRKKDRISYKIEENDSKYIRDLERGAAIQEPNGVHSEKSAADIGKEWAMKAATKHVNNMKLQNLVMQLRKVSSHPFLFDWPSDPQTGELIINDDLVNASGKMLLLNRLLDALFERKHKVLIFSQFTTMLDVIEDWATGFKGLKICRIDGMTKQEDRRAQMKEFNEGGDSPDATKLFLLSTRAGGLGINLVAADTVIFFDNDWNPQVDLQAQDRAHRIGQTKPVLVFRLVSAHTVETKILQKAGNKRKLEALVISQGKFGRMVDENGRVLLGKTKQKTESTAEMARALLDLEGEEINVASAGDQIISDEDLDILLDRSAGAMGRKVGWSAGLGNAGAKTRAEQIQKGERTAFEVFVPAKDDAADGLAAMFAGDGEKEDAEE